LKGHALLSEQGPKSLVADVVDHPLGDQELRQLRQAPCRERQVVVGRARQRDLLDVPSLAQGELGRPPSGVAGVQRVEAVVVEVVEDLPHPVLGGECHLGDLADVHALSAEQHHLGAAPGHHRARAAAHDPKQTVALVVGDLPNLDPLGHGHLLTRQSVE
jgi:hypothetical protein